MTVVGKLTFVKMLLYYSFNCYTRLQVVSIALFSGTQSGAIDSSGEPQSGLIDAFGGPQSGPIDTVGGSQTGLIDVFSAACSTRISTSKAFLRIK